MKTIINRRFIIGLCVAGLLLAAAVHGLHAVQIERQSRFFLDQAHRAQQDKQFDLAAERFRDYLQLAPEDSDALAEFGLMLADHHALREAATTLEKVLRAQPGRDDLRRQLVLIEIETGRAGDAKAHVQVLLRKLPDDAALWNLLGTCQGIGGEYRAASASLKKSIALDATNAEAFAHLAQVLRLLDLPAEADATMEKLVRANPDLLQAHLLAGEYWAQIGSAKEARGETERALQLSPKNPKALLLAAQLALARASYDQARDYARRAIDLAPRMAAAYLTLGRVESLAGNRKAAIACLEIGVEKTQSRDASLPWELGRLQIEAGDLPGAKKIVEILHKLPTNVHFAPRIAYLEAEIELANNHGPIAIQKLEQVASELDRSPDLLKQVRLQIANCYEQLGETDLQLAAFQRAAAIDPAWAPAQLGVARTLLALGKFDEALEECRRITKLDGMATAGTVCMAKLLIVRNLARGSAGQNWKDVDSLLDRLAATNPNSIELTLLRAESLAGQQRAADAEKLLLDARTKFSDRVEVWTALVGLADRRRDWPATEQLLAEANTKFGDAVWLRLTRAAYFLARYQSESPPKLRALGDRTDAFSVPDGAKLFRGLTAAGVEAGDMPLAIGFARRACDADSQNLEVRLYLFELALASGDEPSASQALKEIRDLDGEGAIWHYGQATLSLAAKPTSPALVESAIRHIDAARRLRPGWTALSLLAAQIQDRQGHVGAALQDYLEAIDLGERNPRAIRRAVELLYASQRYSEADQLLRRVEQQPRLFSDDVERLASKVSARLDDLDRALELGSKVARDSKNWQDQVWLGQLESMVGLQAQRAGNAAESSHRFADAEKSLRSAVQSEPKRPETWVALIRFYGVIDRTVDAETAIRDAQRNLTSKTDSLVLASCYEAIGKSEQAAKQYQLALSEMPNEARVIERVAEFDIRYGKLSDAEAILRRIVSEEVPATSEEMTSARRSLAAVFRASGSYPKIQHALVLIEQNLAGGNAAEDLRDKAFSLALCPQPERHRQAIEILEGLLHNQRDADDLRAALSKLYLAENDWPKASKLLRSLIADHDREPAYITVYVSQLLKRQETDEAELWIQRLEQIAPGDLSTVGLRAEVFVQRGDIDAAIQSMRGVLAQAKLSTDEAGKQVRAVAERLEELARGVTGPDPSAAAKLLSEADSMYRKYVAARPEQQLVLANFLARRGRIDEAIAIVESAAQTAEPNALAQACTEIMSAELTGAASNGAKLDERIEKVLLAAIGRHGDSSVLQICLADLCLRHLRFDDAAAIYRSVLETSPSDLVAMNNLAILLAGEKKQLGEAQRLVQTAIATAGPLPALLDSRASVYLALGKPTEALADLEQSIRSEPRPNRQFHRALALSQLGRPNAAAQAIGEARKLGFKPELLGPIDRRDYQQFAATLER